MIANFQIYHLFFKSRGFIGREVWIVDPHTASEAFWENHIEKREPCHHTQNIPTLDISTSLAALLAWV